MNHPDYIVTKISAVEWSVWKEEWNEKEHSFPLPYRVVSTFVGRRRVERRVCNCPHFVIRLKHLQFAECKHGEMTREGAWNESDFSR